VGHAVLMGRTRGVISTFALAAAVVAAVVLVRSCQGEVIHAGDTTVLVAQSSRDGMDALAGGRLAVVGGCLGAEAGETRYVIVWPHGTDVVDEDPLTVDVPGADTYALGDEIRVGGGFVLEHTSTEVEPGPQKIGGVPVPSRCAEYDVFLAN
jgi:hypothetical protein